MVIVFRVVYVALLGGLVLLWYLDFEPRGLTSLFDTAAQSSDRSAGKAAAPEPERLDQRLRALEAAVSSLASGTPPPVEVAELERRMAALDARLEAVERALSERVDALVQAQGADGLERRISELGEQIATLAARPAPAEFPSPEIRRLHAEVSARIGHLETRITELAERQPRVEGASVQAALSEIESRLEAIAERPGATGPVEALDERLAAIDARLEDVTRAATRPVDMSALEARLAALDAAVALIASAPPTDTGTLEARLASLEAGIGGKFETLEADLDALAARPAPEIDTDELEARIAALLSERSPPALETADVRAALSDLKARLDALAELNATLATAFDMSALEARLHSLDTAVTALGKRPAATIETGPLEAKLASLEAGVEARLQTIEAGLARLAGRSAPDIDTSALEAGMAEATARLGGIEGQLAAIDASRIEARIAGLGTHLAEIAATVENLSDPEPAPGTSAGAAQPAAPAGIAIQTTDEAWLRIRDGGRIIFEGLVPGGERIPVPSGLAAPELRAGNAGSVFVLVDGVPYGPLGRPRQVVRDVPLRATEIRERFPRGRPGVVEGSSAG